MAASLRLQRKSLLEQRKSLLRQPSTPLRTTERAVNFIEPIYPLVYSDCDRLQTSEIDQLVAEAAQEQSLPPALIRSVMKHESGFKPCAISVKGAQGLMQLMPATARELHISDPFDPKQNVRAGAALLKRLFERYNGDLRLTLGAYNAGSSRVDEVNRVPDLSETQSYVTGILRDLEMAREQDAPRGKDTPSDDPDPRD